MTAMALSQSLTAFHRPAMAIADKRDIYGGMPQGVNQTKHHNVVAQAKNYLLLKETWVPPTYLFPCLELLCLLWV